MPSGPLPPGVPWGTPLPPPPRKRSRALIYGGGAGALAVIVLVVALVAALSGGGPKPAPPTTTVGSSVPSTVPTTTGASSTTTPATTAAGGALAQLMALIPMAIQADATCQRNNPPNHGSIADVYCGSTSGIPPTYVEYWLYPSVSALQAAYVSFLTKYADTTEGAGNCGNFNTLSVRCETTYSFPNTNNTTAGHIVEYRYSQPRQSSEPDISWTLQDSHLLIDMQGTNGASLVQWWANYPPHWANLPRQPSVPTTARPSTTTSPGVATLMGLIPEAIKSNANCQTHASRGFGAIADVQCANATGIPPGYIDYQLFGSSSALNTAYTDYLHQFAKTTEDAGNCGNFNKFVSRCETAYGPGTTTIGRIVEYYYQPQGGVREADISWTLQRQLVLMDMQGTNPDTLVRWWAQIPSPWGNYTS